MKKLLALLKLSSLLFVSCLSDAAEAPLYNVPTPPVITYTSGYADFSNYVALGKSIKKGIGSFRYLFCINHSINFKIIIHEIYS